MAEPAWYQCPRCGRLWRTTDPATFNRNVLTHTEHGTDAEDGARENVADDVGKNYALATVAGLLQFLGVLSVLFAFIYTSLWAMRTQERWFVALTSVPE